MTPVFVIVAEVATYESHEVALTKDDHVLENLPPATTDPAFRHGILPRTAVRDALGFDAHRPHSVHDGRIEDRVTVEDEILSRGRSTQVFGRLE